MVRHPGKIFKHNYFKMSLSIEFMSNLFFFKSSIIFHYKLEKLRSETYLPTPSLILKSTENRMSYN